MRYYPDLFSLQEDSEGDFVKRAKEGMDDDEATFSVEVPLEKTNMLWSDKYRPRKPRFFNRVHTVRGLSLHSKLSTHFLHNLCENQTNKNTSAFISRVFTNLRNFLSFI